MRHFLLALLLAVATAVPAAAQDDRVWIQIAARQELEAALRVLRDRSRALEGLQGMRMRTGWYAVVLGPFTPTVGQSELTRLRAQGRIPADSFIARRSDFRRQFWPTGRSSLRRGAPLAARQPGPLTVPPPEPVVETAITENVLPDAPLSEPAETIPGTAPLSAMALEETPAEARASERTLDEDARKGLQRALAWFGHYGSAIDGDFGPGTRRAMASWQAAEGHEPSGILTTRQRGLLLAAFRADLAALGLERVENLQAGIAVSLPKGVVTYEGTDAPFVRYKGEGETPAHVVLISQAGDSDRLAALAQVMQTLQIVPEGSRARVSRSSFVIDGATETVTTHVEAALYGPYIKGFALVWPASAPGDAARIAEAMAADFEALPDLVLPDDAGNLEEQDVDLMAGLEIRRPDWTRSGVFVGAAGEAVTLAEGLDQCGRVTLGDELPATVSPLPGTEGLALVTPLSPAEPLGRAALRETPARIGSQVAVALYPHGGRLGAPSTAFGTLGDIRSPGGDVDGLRLAMAGRLGDTGGPILDEAGALLGILMPRDEGGVTPPEGVERGLRASAISAALDAAGVAWTPAVPGAPVPREFLAARASDMVALVSCWP